MGGDTDVIERLPGGWRRALGSRLKAVDLAAIDRFVAEQRQNHEVYPPDEHVFAAFDLTPFESVRAVILGQDPYYQPGLACGLAFSVPTDLPHDRKRPVALRRILAESAPEQNGEIPVDATLQLWAKNGVLLLNTVLTVRQGKAGSHVGHGWEEVTSAVMDAVAAKPGPIVFLLWGEVAKSSGRLIDQSRHIVITSAHPSARLARSDPNSFRGSRPFSRANEELQKRGAPPIDWVLG
jgi:uracil-DNA glycosylase